MHSDTTAVCPSKRSSATQYTLTQKGAQAKKIKSGILYVQRELNQSYHLPDAPGVIIVTPIHYPPIPTFIYLQLGLGLRLLEDGVQLGGLHDIALDLELARHK